MNKQGSGNSITLDLEASFGAIDEIVLVANPKRVIVFANRAAQNAFGYSAEELIGQTSEKLYANPADYEATGKFFRSDEPEQPAKFSILFRDKNARTFNAEVTTTALYDASSAHTGFLSIARDVSDRLAVKAKLNESSAILEDALETISEGFALYDANDRLVVCNEKYKEIYSHSAPAIVPGATFRDILKYGLERGEYDTGDLDADQWIQSRLERHMAADGEVIEQALGDGTWLQIAERKTKSGGRAGIRTDVTALKTAQAQAEKAHHDLVDVADNLSCSITEVNLEGECVFTNKVSAEWFGAPREQLLGLQIRNMLTEENRSKTDAIFRRALAGEHIFFETSVRFPDGILREVAIEYTPKKTADGRQTGVVIYATDITERKKTERTLSELYHITSTRELCTEDKIKLILKLGADHFKLPVGIIGKVIDDHYTVQYVESPDREMLQGAIFELHETYCYQTLKVENPLAIANVAKSELARQSCYRTHALETYIGAPILVDGEHYGTISFTDTQPRQQPFTRTERELIRQFADWIGNEIARKQDHDALIEAQIRLERIASIDDLTGVLNRRAFMERATTEIARFRRTGNKFTVVILDIDHFKDINDTYGHASGDAVLRSFATIATDTLRAVDVFGRVGGEEFCIILDSIESDAALAVCERLRERIAQTCHAEPVSWKITCSMGVATVSSEDVEFSTVLQRADNALYRAKQEGRNRCIVYQGSPSEKFIKVG